MRILLLEDDPQVADALKTGLEHHHHHRVDWANSAEMAEMTMQGESYDAMVVDIGLPGMSGFEFVQRYRGAKGAIPVLFLTALDGIDDLIHGFAVGADDYIVKPYRLPEVAARLGALHRRSNAKNLSILSHNSLRLNSTTRSATLKGVPIELTKREWEILEILLMASPKVVAKEALVQKIIGWDKEITPNNVEVHISRLRQKFGADEVLIRTVRGIGYRIDSPNV
jgi:two-component system response regulator QseB